MVKVAVAAEYFSRTLTRFDSPSCDFCLRRNSSAPHTVCTSTGTCSCEQFLFLLAKSNMLEGNRALHTCNCSFRVYSFYFRMLPLLVFNSYVIYFLPFLYFSPFAAIFVVSVVTHNNIIMLYQFQMAGCAEWELYSDTPLLLLKL